MKISNHLPHFSEPNLLVVAGKQEAAFFKARNDQIHQVYHFKVEKPEYSDNESRRERRGSGGASRFGGGSPFKHNENELLRGFLKQLTDEVIALDTRKEVDKLYLFCPTYLSSPIEDNLPNDIRNKIEFIFFGNYLNQHPFVLLSKIQEFQRIEKDKKIVEPIKLEALEILKKTGSGLSA